MASAIKYIANVGKSVKYATIDVLKEMNPVVTDMIETNQDVAKVTYSSIKNFKSLSSKAMKSLSSSQVGELAKDYKKNLLEDIKNGTFYNKKRQEQTDASILEGDAWGSDTSDFFVDGDSSSTDDSFNSDEFLADSIDDTAERATTAVSKVLARTSEYQVEATRQSTNRILAQTSAMSAQIHSDLGILNTNISGLMKFNTEAMAVHIENSRSFYERQQQQMDEQTSILREMLEFQKSIFTPKTKSMSSKVNVSDIFTSTGAINLAEYFKLIKQNSENIDSMGLGSLAKELLESGAGKSLAANPLGMIMTGAVKGFLPKVLKDSFKEFNDTLSGSIATAIMNASKARDSMNPLVSALGNIFGVDLSNNRKINTSKYNKEATAWNGKDHKALTEVIPTLLNKIYSSISGTTESRYDYEKGKFVSLKDIRRDFNRTKNRYIADSNDTIMPYLENMINQMNFSSTERQKEFVSTLEKILKENFKRGQYFNPNDKSISAKTYGLKGDHAEYDVQLIRRLFSKIPKSKQLLNNSNFFQSQNMLQDWISSIENNGDSVFMSLFNGSSNNKKHKSKSTISPIFTSSEKLDETNSLLREIIDILENGKRTKKSYKKNINNNFTKNTTKKTEKDKKRNTNNGYFSDLGLYVNTSKDAKFNVDTDDIDSFDYIDPNYTDSKTYIKRLQEATSATKKLSAFLSGTSDLAKQPLKFVSNVLKKTDERMYTLLFGSDKDDENSILGKISYGLDIWFDDLRDIARNKFEDIKDWLIGKSLGDKANGLLSKLLGFDTKEWFKDFRKAAFGDENMSMGEGIRKIFKEGFGEMWNSFKNIFKEDETVQDIKSNIKGTKNNAGKESDSVNKGFENFFKAMNRAKSGRGDDGTGDTEPIKGAATGLRKVSKTGVIAVSEGEMIVPPDMNPYNIKKREKSEKDAISKFEKAYGRFNSIYGFARGGSVDIDPEKKEKLDIQVLRIDSIIARGSYDPKKIIRDISKLPYEDQEYIMSHINDDSYVALHKNYKAAKAIYKAKSLGRNAYEKGKENIGYKMMDSAKDFIDDARENEFINNLINKISKSINKNKDATDEGKEVVNDIMSNFSSYLPRIAAGGVTGLALSAMLGLAGGPLLGAAVGSSLGLLSNSKKLQKWLFGEKLIDDEGNETIKGGILGDDLKKNLHKYFPGMSKGAVVGGIASILPFVPGGPMAGILVGSAVGFARSNDDIRKKLFGEDKALSKIGKTLKEKMPRMGLGAAAMFLGGPFGVTTNLMVGSALGFVSDTEKFKDIVFGTKGFDDKRRGGLVGFIKDSAEIPINGIKELFEYSKNWFKKDILDPTARFLKPALQDFKNLGSWIKDGIKSAFTDHLLRPIGGTILSRLIVPLEKQLGKLVNPFAHGLLALASSPFKALGAYGDWRRSRQLRSVGGASGTIAERVLARNQLDSKKPGIFTRAINGIAGRDIINTTKYTDSEANMVDMTFLGMSDEDRMMAGTLAEMVESTGLNKRKNREDVINGNIASLISKQGGLDKVIYNHIDRTNAEMVSQYKQIKNEILTGKCQASIAILKSWVLAGKFPAEYENEAIRELKRVAKIVSERRDKLNNLDQSIKDFQNKTGINMLDRKHRKVAKQAAKEAQLDSDKAINDYYENVTEEANQGTLEEQQLTATLRMQEIQEEISKKLTDINDTLKDVLFSASDATDNNSDISTKNNYKAEQEANTVSETGKPFPSAISNENKTPDDKNVEISATDIITAAQAGQLDIARIMADGKVNKFSKLKSIGNRIINKFRSKRQKSQTVITENGPIKTRFDNRGNEIPDNTDSETKETLAKVEDKNQVQKGILNKLSGLGDSIKGLLGIGDNKEEDKEGIFSKILKGALKYGLPVLGGLAGVGLVSKIANKKINVQQRDANGNKMFDENGNPIMTQMTIADAVKDGASRMWLGDDLTGNTNGAWFHIKDFTRNKIVPMIATGYDILMKTLPGLVTEGIDVVTDKIPYFIEKAVSSIIANAPAVIWAGVKGLVGGLSKALANIFGGKQEREKSNKIESMGIVPTGGILSDDGTQLSSSPTNNLSPNAQTIVKSLQSAIDSGNAGNFTSSGSSVSISNNVNNTTQSALKKIDSSGININNSEFSKNNDDIKNSNAYKNAGELAKNKSLNQLSTIWNKKTTLGMSVGELLNSDAVVGKYTDNNGKEHEITGSEILNYPELAKSFLGIDISATDEERDEQRQKQTPSTSLYDGLTGNLINWGGTGLRMFATNGQSGGAIRAAANINTKAFGFAGDLIKKIPRLGSKTVGNVFKASGLLYNAPAYMMNGVRDYFQNRHLGKGVSDSIKESFKNSTKIFREDFDTTFGKSKNASNENKVVSKIKNSLRNAKDKIEGSKNGKKIKGKAAELLTKFTDLLSNFFKNNTIINNVKNIFSTAAKYRDKADKFTNDFLSNILDYLIKIATKKLGEGNGVTTILKKLSAKLGSYAISGGTLLVVFAVVDFIAGMKNADAIFQVTNPTIVERVISGLVNAVIKRFGIDLFVDTPQLIQKIIELLPDGLLSDDYNERHNEVIRRTQEYNNKHESNISEYEYMMKDKIETKAGNFIGGIGNKIVGTAKGIFNFITGNKSDKSEKDTKSTVDKVNEAEYAATEGSYIYDESGNAIGYDENSDGNPETMYIPQGDSGASDYDTSSIVNTNFNTAGTENNQLTTTADQSQIATSGEGNVVSSENQTLINSAYTEINTAIPDMVRQIKTNLANYFGVRPSDLNRKTNVGMNTMKGDGPLQLFNRLGLMWSQINTRLNPFINNLPTTLFSGMKDLTKFLTNNVGLMGEEGEYTEEDQTSGTAGYTSSKDTKATTATTSSNSNNTSILLSSTTDKDTKKSSSSSSGKKSKSVVSKIASGVKNVIKGIGNFFGIGGSGSGVDDQSHIIETGNSADSKNLFISQKYGKYANTPFTVSGDRNKETVEDAGCAPAVATMAINSAGFSAEPITMDQAIRTAIKYKKPNNGVTADYFVDEFDKHGLNTAFVTSDSANMKDTIIKRLTSGAPIILMGRDDKNTSKSSSPFGSKTHYVVATGISNDKQTIYVNDPESNKPKIPYKASKLLNGVMIGIAPVIRNNNKNKQNSMVTKIKRLLSRFSASGKYGEDTIEYKVWTGLRAAGYSEITVAGTMGNIYAESGFDPSIVERGNGIGFGLIQWSFGRRTAIEKYASEQGKDVNSTELQVEWLLKECDPNDSAFAWMNSSTSYDGKSWTYDEWKNATDIESAVRAFMFCFERPAGTSSLQKRIDAANEYYQEFTGTSVPTNNGNDGGDSETSENQSPLEKLLSAFTKLAQGYGLTGGDSSGSTAGTTSGGDSSSYVDMGDIRGNVSSNKEYAEKQVELVKKMKSVEGKLQYSWGPGSKYPGPSRNPDDGYADCSSTVQWAYQKVLGVDPGSYTGAQETDEDTYTVTNTTADESKMQLGDIILKNGHVEMYYGDGRMIGHGGGKDGKTPGPTIKSLGSTPPYNNIKRWVGFRDSEGSTTFDGATEGGAGTGLFVSQNSPSYANKTIGNRTVADAGCAPAVATMALSKLNKNYNMSKAIKDASKYQNSSGKVTADYFAEAFSKNGIKSSFIPGNNIDKLKGAITNGSVVLLGKDSYNKNKSISPFGPSGHYVLATGLSKDGKYVYIDDPEAKKANKKYPIDILKHTSIGISTLGNITSKISDKVREKLKLFAGTANYKYLFSGDSRTVGISLSIGTDHPETFFIAKVGIGYQWMKDHAWSQIKRYLDSNPNMKVVFLYGVNDISNINNYIKKYKELEGEYDKNRIWYVSVNPIKGQQNVTNEQIQEFNKKLKEHAGSRYIDTYNMLIKDGFESSDGLHYDNDTNTKIYNFIINTINNGANSTSTEPNTNTEVKEDQSPLDELSAAFTKLAQGYGLAGTSESSSTSSGSNTNNSNSSSKGSSFPKYILSEAQKTLAAGVIAGETGGSDLVAAKQEASQMANLNEIQYGKDPTGDNLESTLKGGWYAKASLSKSPTDITLKAVDDVLVNGKRTLPRYVTEHDMFPLDAAISGHWNNGKSEDRSQYKRNSTVISQNPSRFSSPANYKFYDFFGENRDGDVAGYYDQYYDQYKDDVAWSGAGSGLTSAEKTAPKYSSYAKYNEKSNSDTTTKANIQTNNNQSNVDKLVEIVIKLLAQVVDNTSSIKDIASLLVKLLDIKSSSSTNDSSMANTAAKGAIKASQLALQALSESTKNTNNEEILKLIQSVESIAMQ